MMLSGENGRMGMGVDVLFDLFGASYVEAFDYDPGQVRLAEKRLLPRYNEKVRIYEASAGYKV